jgi:predicted Fe-Mo cluster-binding NifX family protein
LVRKKINVVIAGQFGRKMTAALKAGKRLFVEKQGVVIDTVKEQIYAK